MTQKINDFYFREQRKYTFTDMQKRFSEHTERVLEILLKNGVLKQVGSGKEQDLSEMEEEDFALGPDLDNGEKTFVFCFVGVISVKGYILKCLPKYYEKEEIKEGRDEHLKLVFDVIRRYNRRADREPIYLYNDNAEGGAFNLLAVMLYFLQDYYENGLYTNEKEVVETNGSGEILWDRTINNTFAILQEGSPFYMELQTRRRVVDENNYFRQLHQCVLTICSRELVEKGILDLFNLMPVDEGEDDLSKFGDEDYICYQIEQELNVQFNTRKKLLLKTIYTFIKCGGVLHTEDNFSLFGTNAFHVIWEDVCKVVLCDRLNFRIGEIALFANASEGDKAKTLKNYIEKPSWNGQEAQDTFYQSATFIPDVVSVENLNGQWHFSIFDAKYYHIAFRENGQITGQPGIESVSKQFLYEMAYRPLLQCDATTVIHNAFVFPYESAKGEVDAKGVITMPMFTNPVSGPVTDRYGIGLQPIHILLIKPQAFYEQYLRNEKGLKTVLSILQRHKVSV